MSEPIAAPIADAVEAGLASEGGELAGASNRRTFAGALRALSGRALNLLLPPSCPLTGERVAAPGLLSAAGWARVSFIDGPFCARCSAPFAHDEGEGAECAACIADPPAFAAARAAVLYDEASHDLILAFKHGDRTELAPLLAGWLARAGAGLLRPGTILVPTPLHPRRLFARRYNQAGLLAAELGRRAGLAVLHDTLERVRATPSQKDLSADARRRNVQGAFGVPDARRAAVEGAAVVIIDDVMTTGATLSACARALKKAGAARVDALVLARAVKPGQISF